MFEFSPEQEAELTKARGILEKSLSEGSISYLLSQMDNRESYSPIFEEKHNAGSWESTDTISWYAFRRAEELNQEEDKKELLDKLQSESDNEKRRHILFCLGHLCKKTEDKELFNFLMGHFEKEKDKACKSSLLVGLRELKKGEGYNIDPLIKVIIKGTKSAKSDAIIALENSDGGRMEKLLLPIFQETKDSALKTRIANNLETNGSSQSLPFLKEGYKKTRDNFLRLSIKWALEAITEREKGK